MSNRLSAAFPLAAKHRMGRVLKQYLQDQAKEEMGIILVISEVIPRSEKESTKRR